MRYTEKNVLVSVAGAGKNSLLSKIKEINQRKITRACLFLTMVDKTERRQVYQALLKSTIKEIPLVHLRNDMSLEEVLFLEEHFHPTYYTIHANSFRYLFKWLGFKKRLYLETSNSEKILDITKVEIVGGFCVDLAHFKIEEKRQSPQYKYQMSYAKQSRLFVCNHLNGYSYFRIKDLHLIRRSRDLSYLKTLPSFIFGKIIALEMKNPIREQLIWRRQVLKILKTKFK